MVTYPVLLRGTMVSALPRLVQLVVNGGAGTDSPNLRGYNFHSERKEGKALVAEEMLRRKIDAA